MNFAKIIVVITVVSAAVMELIDTSIVNVGLSVMAGNLGVTIEDVSWVVTSYAIANVIIIPLTGFLQRYFGRKNYFMVSIAVFTIASYFCAVSDSLWMLVFFRFLQGVGGGALLSVSQGILYDTFRPDQRAMASAMFGIGIVLGPTFGPTLGGIIIDNYHWSWMFLINIPIGILALFLSYTYIERSEEEKQIDRSQIRIDTAGIVLLAVWVGSLQYVLERGAADDWFDDPVITRLTLLAVFSFVGFIWWELRSSNPVVDLRVFNNRNLTLGTILIVVVGFGLFGSVYLYPLFAQRVAGYTARLTGSLLIPGAGITLFIFPMVGRLLSKGIPARNLVFIGYIFFFGFTYYMSTLNADVYPALLVTALMIRGVGLAFTNIPLINSSVSDLSPKELPMGIAITNMFRQLGGAMGIAILNTYINNHSAQHRADLSAGFSAGMPVSDERVAAITNSMISKGINPLEAGEMAYRNIDLSIAKQSLMLAYLDSFQLVALFFLGSLPLILLVKPRKASAATVKAAAESH